jgi:hypothetical protein
MEQQSTRGRWPLRQRRRKSEVFLSSDTRLVFRSRDLIRDRRKLLAILRSVLHRTEVEPKFVDLTGELERTIERYSFTERKLA